MHKIHEKYHFIGIGGIGMSALARILLEKKIPVSGSDLSMNDSLIELKEKGAVVRKGHSASYISPQDIVVYTTDIKKAVNPEFQAALALKCQLLHRSELLAHLMKDYQTIAVTGTHGKTTTTSLLSMVFLTAGLDPTFAVGGMIGGINGKLGKGPFFVAEADESDGSFLNYHPFGAIVTNVEREHMDFYKKEANLFHAFEKFMTQVKRSDLLFYCEDDPMLSKLAKGKGVSYGFSKNSSLRISRFCQKEWASTFDVTFEGKVYPDIILSLPGEHSVSNAAAVFGISLKMGVKEESIREAFKNFSGVERRCQKRKEIKNVLFLDDYAHHPTEIMATLKAVKRAILERRLIVIFQPHRYSRVKDLLAEFGKAFVEADHVFVTDIYGSREEPIKEITPNLLVSKIKEISKVPCRYLAKEELYEEIQKVIRPHDVVITLGAGDITHFHRLDFSPKKLSLGLIFGGLSCEHEISLRSSRFVYDSLNPDLYDVICFGIDKNGNWVTGEEAVSILKNEKIVVSKNAASILDPKITQKMERCDVFLPILHGTYGEDGTLQGFFEMINKPYIGPDWRAAAISMDKILTKRLVEAAGVFTPKDYSFSFIKWNDEKEKILNEVNATFSFPVYVKPVHLGSSVGITRVESKEELEKAISFAFSFDFRVMVEEAKLNCRELEFAVLGNSNGYQVAAPPPGEKLANGSFVDYEKKYGSAPVQSTVTVEMDPEILKKGQELAKKAYLAVGSSGMTRVDFLLDEKGEFWLFEMNPIPGLQQFSLFPKIWNREGLNGRMLFDRLIVLAMQRKEQQNRHFQTL